MLAYIFLLNETSVRNTDQLKIFNYNVFTKNKRNEQFAGASIAIRNNINIYLVYIAIYTYIARH